MRCRRWCSPAANEFFQPAWTCHICSATATTAQSYATVGSTSSPLRALADSTIPVVAALTGHAPAGGCVLALCCDYRVMARSPDPAHPVSIGLNETEVGLVAPEGIQRLLRRVIGAHRAERLLVAGELVSAERALEIGLIDELADAQRVVARAVAWLQELLQRPRQPMLQTRAIARADLRAALSEEHLALERLLDNWHTPDTQTALHALVKRLSKR